jgi:hypothetical protein
MSAFLERIVLQTPGAALRDSVELTQGACGLDRATKDLGPVIWYLGLSGVTEYVSADDSGPLKMGGATPSYFWHWRLRDALTRRSIHA